MKLKYVMFEDRNLGPVPLVFPTVLVHADVARRYGGKVVSAGFVQVSEDALGRPEFHCYGESISLNVKSDPKDSKILNMQANIY